MPASRPTCSLHIHLFGSPSVSVAGQAVEGLHRRRAIWLLSLLALRANSNVERKVLAGLLYDDRSYEEAKALRSLSQTLLVLKNSLGSAYNHLRVTKTTLCLNADGAYVDLLAFRRSMDKHDWEAALSEYDPHRTFLEGFPENAEDGCAEVDKQRSYLEGEYCTALVNAAKEAVALHRYDTARDWARKAKELRPWDQAAVCAVMEAHAGQKAFEAVESEFRRLSKVLDLNMGVLEEETENCYQRLKRDAAAYEASIQAAREVINDPHTPHNIPSLSGALIGREDDVSKILRRLRTEQGRIVTLWGAGGVGKTWLALVVADKIKSYFLQGAWFVDLASLKPSEGRLIPSIVASALRLEGKTKEAVLGALESSNRLLLLDNCEHVRVDCREFVTALRARCGRIHILATSQQPLRARNEFVWEVRPLGRANTSDPNEENLSPEELLQQDSAVRLLVEQIQMKDRDFTLSLENAAAVKQICERLGGIPLALVMAAANARAMDIHELADRLKEDGRFDLLINGEGDERAHHQTLKALMDWSYDLLDPEGPERDLLARLSIFAGGWSLRAAETICTLHTKRTFTVLGGLVDKAWVVYNRQADRYSFLETAQIYAQTKLTETESGTALRRLHLNCYMDLAKNAENDRYREVNTPDRSSQRVWMDILEVEHANLRAALDWTLTPLADARALNDGSRLAVALAHFWNVRNHWSEAERYLNDFISRCEAAGSEETPEPETLAAAFNHAGSFAVHHGDYLRARSLLLRGWNIARGVGPRQEADILVNIGYLASRTSSDEVPPDAKAVHVLKTYQRAGDWSEGKNRAELGSFWARFGLGWDYFQCRDFSKAREQYCIARKIARKYDDEILEGHALQMLSQTALEEGLTGEAFKYACASLVLRQKVKDLGSVAACLETLCSIALTQMAWQDAVILGGMAWCSRQSAGIAKGTEAGYRASLLVAVEAQADQINAWWSKGASRTRNQILSHNPQEDFSI